jgi:hypothetical protein
MSTKVIVAAVLAFLAYFFSGWGVYEGLINKMMVYPEGMKDTILYSPDEFKISFMALSCLIWAVMIAWLLDKLNVSTWQTGAKYGALIGGFVALTVGFAYAAQYKFGSLNNTLFDAIGSIVTSGIAGAAAGWWLGRK